MHDLLQDVMPTVGNDTSRTPLEGVGLTFCRKRQGIDVDVQYNSHLCVLSVPEPGESSCRRDWIAARPFRHTRCRCGPAPSVRRMRPGWTEDSRTEPTQRRVQSPVPTLQGQFVSRPWTNPARGSNLLYAPARRFCRTLAATTARLHWSLPPTPGALRPFRPHHMARTAE
ncbi:hypothetical protein FKP32DRAFT_1143129 [Trametes sanguinea]|nr:hypothetical protein FKP32DRAFT_1143129 [Trametes sanguinea]